MGGRQESHTRQMQGPFMPIIAQRGRKGKVFFTMAKRATKGSGTIRKKIITRNGKKYEWWEARYTIGSDPGTGKQVQKTITGKTQKEVAQKLKAATLAIDTGTYIAPSKQTVGQWLDTWADTYLGNVKPFTAVSYKGQIKNHINPAIGAVRLESLNTATIQRFYNNLAKTGKKVPKKDTDGGIERSGGKIAYEYIPLSAKTIKNVHGVLHKALQQAVANGMLRANPADACTLPRVEKAEIHPLDEVQTRAFIEAIKGHEFETLFTVTLFTGMREGEILGLTWDCVDFSAGTILIKQQLQKEKKAGGCYQLVPLKNDKPRSITPAPWVMDILRKHRQSQTAAQLRAGSLWSNPENFVFTNEIGGHLVSWTVAKKYKRIVTQIGRPDARFHDLRHSYAAAAIRAGDDIKTVQDNLGHATASFTLDVYGHVTEQMKQASAKRQQDYIKSVLGL